LAASSLTFGHSSRDSFVDRLVEIDASFAGAKRIGAGEIHNPAPFSCFHPNRSIPRLNEMQAISRRDSELLAQRVGHRNLPFAGDSCFAEVLLGGGPSDHGTLQFSLLHKRKDIVMVRQLGRPLKKR
jgi:hypothetical protein